jgi:hypothetical protein
VVGPAVLLPLEAFVLKVTPNSPSPPVWLLSVIDQTMQPTRASLWLRAL